MSAAQSARERKRNLLRAPDGKAYDNAA